MADGLAAEAAHAGVGGRRTWRGQAAPSGEADSVLRRWLAQENRDSGHVDPGQGLQEHVHEEGSDPL